MPRQPSRLLALLLLAFAGSAALAQTQPAPAPKTRPPAAATEAAPSGLTADVLHQFLVAEFAARAGDISGAVDLLTRLARSTRDGRVAQRAVEIALSGRAPQLAINAASQWLELEPDSPMAQQAMLALRITVGKPQDAAPHVRQMLAKDPAGAPRIFSHLGSLVGRSMDKAAAAQLMRDLAKGYESLPEARMATAQAARATGDFALVRTETAAALALRPGWELAAMMHAEALDNSSERNGVAFTREFLKKYPQARDLRRGLAQALIQRKDLAGARTELLQLIDSGPVNPELHLEVAQLSLELKDHDAAEVHLKKLLELGYREPNTLRVYLGQLNEAQKKTQEALGWYRQVTDGEQFTDVQVRIAVLLAKDGGLETGRAHLQQMARDRPAHATQFIIAESQMLREAKRNDEALAVLSEGIRNQPQAADLFYDRAMVAERLGKFAEMEADFRKVIELKPDWAHGYNALGYTFADRGVRLAEARSLIEKALALAPTDAAVLDSMGWVLHKQGETDRALDYLKRAYAARSDAEIAAHLAEVLLASGDKKQARAISQQALKDDPDNEALLAVSRKLDR